MNDLGDQTDTLLGNEPPPQRASSASSASAPPAHMLGGRYLLEERIANGGMASVWRAHDEVLARTVAVKILHDHLAEDDAFRERFRREAVTAARLAHPKIVSLYDTGSDNGQVFLVMEFVDGQTLRDVIAAAGALEIGLVATVGRDVAQALDYAHARGLVHRDVKPANILIGADASVKVADFGIAKADQDPDLTRTGMVLGTAAYVAPEQVRAQPLDGRADQYSLGCVLYEALTARRPFKGESPLATAAQRLQHDPPPPRSLRGDIPRAIEQIVLRAMARDPADRFPSCQAFADALSAFAEPDEEATVGLLAVAAEPTTVLRPASQPTAAHRRAVESFLRSEGRWLAPVAALLLLAGLLVGAGLMTGVLESGGGLMPRLAKDESADEVAVPLKVALREFDPESADADGENGEDLDNLLDGKPQTLWRTEGYRNAAFGGLKSGVGFVVDLGQVRTVRAVELTTPYAGLSYELRAADRPAPDPADWNLVQQVPRAARGRRTIAPEAPLRTRYLLVWVLGGLQRDGGHYYGGFSELVVLGQGGGAAAGGRG